jgi:hypothetical protein
MDKKFYCEKCKRQIEPFDDDPDGKPQMCEDCFKKMIDEADLEKDKKTQIFNFQCRCKEPRIREVAYCEECLGGFPSMLSFRGRDNCSSTYGITDFDIVDDKKIFRCDHYVYCPLCGWRCESEEDLERHLNATDNDGKRICEGAWRYGAYGINQVKNELKYWRLYKKRER